MFDLQEIEFGRCVKPLDAAAEDPILVLFSDGSEKAYGSCAYIRWKPTDGSFAITLLCARVAPLNIIIIVRLELNGCLLSKRLKSFIEKTTRIQFSCVYFLIDSQVVLAMLQKQSYGFQSYVAVRVGEMQEGTQLKDWYWIESCLNIADCLTRGNIPSALGKGSVWQDGPQFLQHNEENWPIRQDCNVLNIPESIRQVFHTAVTIEDSLAKRINIERFSSYMKLLFTTARILAFYKIDPQPSFKNALQTPTIDDLNKAEAF